MSKFKRNILIILLLVALGLTGLVLINDQEASRRNQIYDQARLTEMDKISLE